MNRLISFAAVLVLAMLLTAPVATAQIQERVSDITGMQRVVSDDLRDVSVQNYEGDDMAYKVEYAYNPNTDSATWQLVFYGFAPRPTDMSAADRVLVWIDSQRVQSQDAESRMRRMDDTVLEMQTATFSPSIFERIAQAESVELTIGSAEFALSYSQRADMRAALQSARQMEQRAAEQRRANNTGR